MFFSKSPSARQVVAKDFLISDATWEDLQIGAPDLDFVVIGSGVSRLSYSFNNCTHSYHICYHSVDSPRVHRKHAEKGPTKEDPLS
jgi:hypothetical protein